MPKPMAPNDGAPSSTRAGCPQRASASAAVSPPSPPPTMRIGFLALTSVSHLRLFWPAGHRVKAYWEAVHPFDLGGAYPNFMMDDEGEARLKATYGENYNRLATINRKYDPANLFQANQNIRPSA